MASARHRAIVDVNLRTVWSFSVCGATCRRQRRPSPPACQAPRRRERSAADAWVAEIFVACVPSQLRRPSSRPRQLSPASSPPSRRADEIFSLPISSRWSFSFSDAWLFSCSWLCPSVHPWTSSARSSGTI
jgi:hypothetical protein